MRISAALLVVCALTACAPVGAPSSSARPEVSATMANAFSMATDPDMITFAADRGALVAFSTKSTPPPYESKVQRADPATRTWRTVYQTDARFEQMQIAAGRIGLFEYREPPQSAGAFSVKIMVVDLTTGTASMIDGFAMSSATFRGGGSAPRRPGVGLALAADRIAWTRLIEGPNGSWTGELAVAPLADPAHKNVIASSTEWVTPLAIDSTRLVYVIGGKNEDELHVRDLASGADAVIARAAVGNTAIVGRPGMDDAAISGKWAVWPENDPGPATKGAAPVGATIHALDLTSGTERTFEAGGSYCPQITAGTRYIAWTCFASGGANSQLYDAVTMQPVVSAPPDLGVGVIASGDGLIWFRPQHGAREVTLYRPR